MEKEHHVCKSVKPLHSMRFQLVMVGLAVICLGGCISTKSFVDSSFTNVRYEDLKRRAEPYKWRLVVEFQSDGSHLQRIDSELQSHVERVLRTTGIAALTTDANAPQLKVIVNNIGDKSKAIGKGVSTGLTFGLAGSMVTDYYEMIVTLTQKEKAITRSGYKHALHTTIGRAQGPPGLQPTTPSAGFGKIVEDMLLNALKDLEKELEVASAPVERYVPRKPRPLVGQGAQCK